MDKLKLPTEQREVERAKYERLEFKMTQERWNKFYFGKVKGRAESVKKHTDIRSNKAPFNLSTRV